MSPAGFPGEQRQFSGLWMLGGSKVQKDRRVEFLRGAFILATASFLSRLIGVAFRIVIPRIIGTYGVGLFSQAYAIYNVFLSLSTVGVPLAVSKMIADRVARSDMRGASRVMRAAMTILGASGLVFAVLLILGAGPLARRVYLDPKAYWPIVAIAPAIFLVSIEAGFRGFYQGLQQMAPSGYSQLIEQLVRVAAMFMLVAPLVKYGVEYAAAWVAFTSAIGAVAGILYLFSAYLRGRPFLVAKKPASAFPVESLGSIMWRIVAFTIPVSISAMISPLMGLVDAALVPGRLHAAGLGVKQATELYGVLSGMALPVANLPTVLSGALAVSLVPTISEAWALEDRRLVQSRALAGMRVAALISLPAAVGLIVLGPEISHLLYGTAAAGLPLAALAVGLFFVAFQQVSSGVLQGSGRSDLPVRNLFWGALVKTIFTWFLTGISWLGVVGAAVASDIGYLVSAALNVRSMSGFTGAYVDFVELLGRPALASLIMAAGVEGSLRLGLYVTHHTSIATVGAILVGLFIYIVSMAAMGGLTRNDLDMVPALGPALARWLGRLGLLKK